MTVTISISFGHFVRDFTALASQGNSKVSPKKNCRGAMAPFPFDNNISRPFHTVTDSRSLAYVLPHMKENDLARFTCSHGVSPNFYDTYT